MNEERMMTWVDIRCCAIEVDVLQAGAGSFGSCTIISISSLNNVLYPPFIMKCTGDSKGPSRRWRSDV